MNTRRKKNVLLSLMLITTLLNTQLLFANPQNQLSEVEQAINQLSLAQKADLKRQEQLHQNLGQTEKNISRLSQLLNELETRMKKAQQHITTLKQQRQDLKNTLQKQATLLAKHLNTYYQLGHEPFIKFLLNQQNPNLLSRMSTYFRYINQERVTVIQSLSKTQQDLKNNETDSERLLSSLKSLQKIKLSRHNELQNAKIKQYRLSKKISDKINSRQAKINQHLLNKKQLESLLHRLEERPSAMANLPFSDMRQKLAWPVSGKLINQFGKNIASSELLYNGIRLLAPEKRKVAAVYPGKVVFADWLRGFGLLIIISHGQGYMTLYANNHSLLKKTGESVNLGDAIATVGHSGGQKNSGLYFEIRKNGKPLSPTSWLKHTG